jgi:hypothetical protein
MMPFATQTTMALLSGGRAIPGRQILHEISGWVKHIPAAYLEAQPSYDYANNGSATWFANLPNLPNTSVHLLGNTLHDDPNYPWSGSLYYVTAAGAGPILFTPTVDGDNDFYAFGINNVALHYNDQPSFTDAPYPLKILANNIDLSTNTPEFCVGQSLNFTTSWGGPPPGTANVQWVHWHLPGKFVNEPVPSMGGYYDINQDLLIGWTTHCWYQNTPGGACSIGTRLQMSNGQEVNVAASGSFTVYRPKISTFQDTPPSWATNCDGWLQLGDDNGHGDMNFEVDVSSKYPGKTDFTQLIYRVADNGSLFDIGTDSQFWLDNHRFYIVRSDNPNDPHNVQSNVAFPLYFSDNPGIPEVPLASTEVYIYDEFRDYVEFRPNAGNPNDNIYVTLGMVKAEHDLGLDPSWGWHAYSTYTSGQWYIQSSDVTRPVRTDESDPFTEWSNIYNNNE